MRYDVYIYIYIYIYIYVIRQLKFKVFEVAERRVVFSECFTFPFNYDTFCLFVFWSDSPPGGPGPPHSRGFSITHNDTPQSVGLFWTSDQPVAETST